MEFVFVDNKKRLADEDIIKDVLHVKNYILKKETLTMREYLQNGQFSSKAIKNHFGSWNNLLNHLNLKITRKYEKLTKEDLFRIIGELWVDLKHQPSLREFEKMSHHTKKIINTNFGSWNNCLKECVEWLNKNNTNLDMGKTHSFLHKTPREPSKSLRYDVLKRDNYKCVKCGRSPASHTNLNLHIDHIVPYSLGGETELNNLQTLCSDCNLGKSNKND